MKSLIPIVMAGIPQFKISRQEVYNTFAKGIIAVYGLVVSVLVVGNINPKYSLFSSFVHLGAGLSTGFSGMAAGYAIGIVGDQAVRSYGYQPRIFVGMVLILIFAEVLGLYGLIVSLILNTRADNSKCT